MNQADEAQVVEEMDRGAALVLIQRQIAAGQLLETAKNCTECGDMIPSARQAAVPGCQHCIRCAEELEQSIRRARGAMVLAI
jgi:phage/conjugal plasmid C-4 type zinc finger TraR family protein